MVANLGFFRVRVRVSVCGPPVNKVHGNLPRLRGRVRTRVGPLAGGQSPICFRPMGVESANPS